MYQSPLRRVLSGKLLLVPPILLGVGVLLTCFFLPQLLSASLSASFNGASAYSGGRNRIPVSTFVPIYTAVMVFLSLGVYSIPTIGLVKIYRNARSGRRFRTIGFSLLKGYAIFMLVSASCSVITTLFNLPSFLAGLYQLTLVGLNLASSILLVKATGAVKSYAEFGCTHKRIPKALPVIMLIVLVLDFLGMFLSLFSAVTSTSMSILPVSLNLLPAGPAVAGFLASCVTCAGNGIAIYLISEIRKALPVPETTVS